MLGGLPRVETVGAVFADELETVGDDDVRLVRAVLVRSVQSLYRVPHAIENQPVCSGNIYASASRLYWPFRAA